MAKTKSKTTSKSTAKVRKPKKTVKSYMPEQLPKAPKSFKEKDIPKMYALFRNKRVSMQFYQGRVCLFFKMYGKFKNEILSDGFIADSADKRLTVPKNIKMPFIASIFVKFPGMKEHVYLGDVNNVVNAKGKNKFLWG